MKVNDIFSYLSTGTSVFYFSYKEKKKCIEYLNIILISNYILFIYAFVCLNFKRKVIFVNIYSLI